MELAGADVELGAEVVETGPGVAELAGSEVVGDVAPGLPGVGEAGVGLADGAGSRATVVAAGSCAGVRLQYPRFTVPCCTKSVAAAT